MNELTTQKAMLPDTINELSKFVLVGREKLVAVRAEIRAIKKVGLAQEVREQKLHEAQDIADAVNVQSFNKELDKIRETLYADNEKNWNEKAFLDVFCKIACQLKKRKKTIHEPLPKLYK